MSIPREAEQTRENDFELLDDMIEDIHEKWEEATIAYLKRKAKELEENDIS